MDCSKLNISHVEIMLVVLVWASFNRTTAAFVSTACFSKNINSSPDCIMHKLKCNDTAVINIIAAKYGYKRKCQSFVGVPNCGSAECCTTEESDCSLPFNNETFKNVTQMCSGKSNCSLEGTKNTSVCNDIGVNAYTLIEYTCDVKDKPAMTSTPRTRSKSPSTTSRKLGTTTPSPVTATYHTTSSGTVSTETLLSTTPVTSLSERDIFIISGAAGGVFILIMIIVIITCIVRRSSNKNPRTGKPATNKTEAITRRKTVRKYDEVSVDTTSTSPVKAKTVPEEMAVQDSCTYLTFGEDNSSKVKNRNDNYNHVPFNYQWRNDQAMGDNSGDDVMPDTYDHIGQMKHVVHIDDDTYNHVGFK